MSQESALAPAVTAMHVKAVEDGIRGANDSFTAVDELGVEEVKASKGLNLNTLRIATQVRELALQGVTLKNTFKEMQHVWESLLTEDKRCLIVEQEATKVKYQLVNLYAIKLIKYLRSIVGLDLVPLAQQDPETRTWKMDAIILNIASNKVKDHEHLFRLFLVNLFGLNEQLVDLSLEPTWAKYRDYIRAIHDFDLGDTDGVTETPDLELIEGSIHNFLAGQPLFFY